MKLAIIASHPIQYQAPIFAWLAAREDVSLRVFFGDARDASSQGSGFGVEFEWDVPLRDGYESAVFAQGLESIRDLREIGRAWRCLRGQLEDFHPDVVLHSGWHHPCMFPALGVVLTMGLPCMLRCEANLLRPRNALQKAWHRILLRRYSAYLPIGKANAAYYDTFGSSATPRFFSPYCSGRQFASVDVTRSAARAMFGLGPGEYCFLFAGKFVSKKHPADLIRAVKLLPADLPVRVLLVGSGSEEPMLRKLAEEFEPGRILFAGFLNQSRMPEAYAAADCLVLPSDAGETWGLVVNEAMAFGLPAIVSDKVGCAPDLVRHESTGFVYRCGDVAELSRYLCRMAGDPAGSAAMGTRAREAVAEYSTERAGGGIREGARFLTGRSKQ